MENISNKLIFFVNGKKVTESNPDPEFTLLRYLREKLFLCGTKVGCSEGGCGACTVMISKFDRVEKKIKHFAVNACIYPVCAVHGLAVTTVEGIGSTRTKLHPVQERIAKAHGSQCGFCTPGIVMSMYALLRNSPKPSLKELETAFQGNLCRCTGYRPIIEGYMTFTKEFECGMGEKCCKLNGNSCSGNLIENQLFEPNEFAIYDPNQEPIFPPELKLNEKYDQEFLSFESSRGIKWLRPCNLKQLLKLKNENPSAKIVVGNTEIGIEVKFKNFDYKILINPSHVRELYDVDIKSDRIKFGAAVSLNDMREILQKEIEKLPEYETRIYRAIDEMLKYFSSQQIRNVASAGGSVMTSTPISDLAPIFLAASVELEVESLNGGRRKLKIDENFFTSYRKNIIKEEEILISISIPKTSQNVFFHAYKQAKRRDDDIAIVNAAFYIKLNDDIVEDARLAFGGMAATSILAIKTGKALKGMKWNEKLIELVNKNLIEEISLSADAPGGVVSYRRSLTLSLFFKAFLSISIELEKSLEINLLSERDKSAIEDFHPLPPKATQLYEKVSSDQSITDPIHRPKVHVSAFKQATGEAIYCDDIPRHENELYLAPILSTKAYAKIISIDTSEALKLEGVHAFFSAKDLSEEQNRVGPFVDDEVLFATDEVTCCGQLIGVVAAENQIIAQRASKLVKVQYEELSPVIVNLEDAIEKKSYYSGYPKTFLVGNFEKDFNEADHVVEGQVRTGGPEHFYLETNSTIAIPKDSDEIEIFASTQQPCDHQVRIANLLNIPQNKVVVKTKRIGGAFGGKETRGIPAILPVALAAYKLKRPVRMILDRDEDMMMTGGRHPFLFQYKVAFNNDGKIKALDVKAYCNAGYSMDCSFLLIEFSYGNIMNAYKFGSMRFEGSVMKTNTRSNTAFRGTGAPQGMFAAEHIIRHVALALGKDYLEIMQFNMLKTGDLTHYNQLLDDCNVRRCFEQVQISSELQKRRQEVEKFNNENRWKKRGISLTNCHYGVGFPKNMMQGGALVNIYKDGTVLVTHGGVEMGQGLHTKTIQVASKVLQIPMELIHVQESSSDKVPNASTTAASVSSDLYGGAVMNACQKLFDRLKPYRNSMPDKSFKDWVNAAWFDRIPLSATGFFAPDGMDPKDTSQSLVIHKHYYTHGSAVTEVEIDCLTGDHKVIRTDIVMDVGSSLNPALDVGQIEGAFILGYGLFTLEELIYSPDGTLYSRGPGMYKIPGFSDIPREFNVSLLTGTPNPRAVYSSRAIGEPPICLSNSVFFAIKEAISAARKEKNLEGNFYFKSPATSARIRMACEDEITEKFVSTGDANLKPWNVNL